MPPMAGAAMTPAQEVTGASRSHSNALSCCIDHIDLSQPTAPVFRCGDAEAVSVGHSDRALLRAESTAIEGDGEELAEFREWVVVTCALREDTQNAPCHHPRKEWSPTRG